MKRVISQHDPEGRLFAEVSVEQVAGAVHLSRRRVRLDGEPSLPEAFGPLTRGDSVRVILALAREIGPLTDGERESLVSEALPGENANVTGGVKELLYWASRLK